MARFLSHRVVLDIPPREGDMSDLRSELLPSEEILCQGLAPRSLAAAAAAKRALVGLAAVLGFHVGTADFIMGKTSSGSWEVQRWPTGMPRPLISVAHSKDTAIALAACQEKP